MICRVPLCQATCSKIEGGKLCILVYYSQRNREFAICNSFKLKVTLLNMPTEFVHTNVNISY